MGTNIYLVRQVTEDAIQKLRDTFEEAIGNLQNTRDTWKVLEPLEDYLNKLKEEIHICKRSYGWQLLFQSHKDLYDCTWESMTNYIKKVLDAGEYIMIDEYGDPYSLEDLKDDLEHFKNGYTGASYDAKKRAEGKTIYAYESCENFEYISDNLRWTDRWFS